MNALQLLQMGLLVNTSQHYTSKNRGTKRGSTACSYSRGCAVGRLIRNKKTRAKMDRFSDSGIDRDGVFACCPPSVQRYGMNFLKRLQSLHDIETHWDVSGLTAQGQASVNSIAKDILAGKFPA